MATFELQGPDGKVYEVDAPDQRAAVSAFQKMFGGPQPFATRGDGKFYRMEDGSEVYKSPGYSTNDPEQVKKLLEGAQPIDLVQKSYDEQVLSEAPVGSRAAAFMRGVPFVGEYTDEALGATGLANQGAVRAMQGAMERERPSQNVAAQIGGGIAGSIPMLAATPAGAAASAAKWVASPVGRASQAGRAALLGAGAGAVEGAVSGAGMQDDRAGNAAVGGAVGGFAGGILGGVAPLVSEGITNLVSAFRKKPFNEAAKRLGTSEDAARVVGSVLDFDNPQGKLTMLADAGPASAGMLDTAMQMPGAAKNARAAVEKRAAEAMDSVNKALDRSMGIPQGRALLKRALRQGSQPARSEAYDLAYSMPIDYSADAGRTLEGLLSRVPQRAFREAKELLQLDGHQSKQLFFDIADNGDVTVTRMPDVREWDYVKRALDQVALTGEGKGALGGQTPKGVAYEGLARQIRDNLRAAVPEYGQALETAADVISQVKGVDTGYSVFRPSFTREDMTLALEGATGPEKQAIASGARQFIDDVLANVKAIASDPNQSAREARGQLSLLGQRASRDKLQMLLGDAAAPLLARIDEAAKALNLRAQVATNSRTAGRQAGRDFVEEMTSGGVMDELTRASPTEAARRLIQELTGATPANVTAQQQKLFNEIAELLTRPGEGNTAEILRRLAKARGKEILTAQEAKKIANAVTTGALGGAYLATTRQ